MGWDGARLVDDQATTHIRSSFRTISLAGSPTALVGARHVLRHADIVGLGQHADRSYLGPPDVDRPAGDADTNGSLPLDWEHVVIGSEVLGT